jgi:transposase
MTTARVEVITSVERRRRWSAEEKERLVAAAMAPGANASEIARSAGVHASQLFRWRRQLVRSERPSGFAAVAVTDARTQGASGGGTIEIEFAGGIRARISGAVDPAMVSAAIGALAAERRR